MRPIEWWSVPRIDGLRPYRRRLAFATIRSNRILEELFLYISAYFLRSCGEGFVIEKCTANRWSGRNKIIEYYRKTIT